MDAKLKKLVQQLLDKWKALDKKKKAIISCSAAAAVVILIIILTAMNTTKYELLCSGLTSSEAGEVYNAVSAKSVPVKVSGTDIYVQKGTADALRMELAEQGLPQGNLPYDVYSSGGNDFAETDQDKAIKQLQQTQNRLQDTIETIPGVNQAIVNIAQSTGDDDVLDTDKTPTTASVKLSLSDGTTLTKDQVKGIVQLVANSVSGLTADNVTVADSDGTVLNDTPDATDDTMDQLQMKTQYESSVKAKLMQMLDQIYGNGNVNVVVNADIDFSSVSTLSNSYTSGVANYITDDSEYTQDNSSGAAGVAGVSGAQPAYPSTTGSGTTDFSSKTSHTTSMLVGSVQQQIEKVGGTLNKLTVAVMLNSNNTAAAQTDPIALKQDIADAVGTSVNDISIGQMGFSSTTPISSATSAGGSSLFGAGSNLLYTIVAGALLLIVIVTLLLVFLNSRKKKREQKAQEALLAAQAEAQAAEADTAKKAYRMPVAPLKSIEETIAESESNSFKKEIEDFTDKKPDLVAQILKNWLKD